MPASSCVKKIDGLNRVTVTTRLTVFGGFEAKNRQKCPFFAIQFLT